MTTSLKAGNVRFVPQMSEVSRKRTQTPTRRMNLVRRKTNTQKLTRS